MISQSSENKGTYPTKKELILKICEEKGFAIITSKEIESINAELEKALGAEGRTSASYIANVLLEAGKEVHYKDLMVKSQPPEQYKEELENLLQFKDFSQAEQTLRRMTELQRQFKQSGQREGLKYLRQLAEKGHKRCLMIAKNEKVDASKRAEKKEIAFWFKLWLDSPGIFYLWLDLRKQSPEFHEKFGKK